jgi:maltose O-acetyltransferase
MKGARYLARATARGRVLKYQAMSTCPRVVGTPRRYQPVLFLGEGEIRVGQDVDFGWPTSVGFYTGYCHVEAVTPESVIAFADGVQINNNAFLKSEGPGIRIGPDALLGSYVEIFDSDFHELDPARRRGGRPNMGAVELCENVFIGEGAKILKGVTIGAHSVIGAGSVVARSIPEGVIAVGNPARVVRDLAAPPGAAEARKIRAGSRVQSA